MNDVGQMDTLVELQSCTVSVNAKGAKSYSFVRHSDVFAAIASNTDEEIGNFNLEAGESKILTIYKVDELTTRWRVLIGGKPYAISYIDLIDRLSSLCRLTVSSISESL